MRLLRIGTPVKTMLHGQMLVGYVVDRDLGYAAAGIDPYGVKVPETGGTVRCTPVEERFPDPTNWEEVAGAVPALPTLWHDNGDDVIF